MASLPVTSSAPSPSRPHSPTQQLQERGLVPQQHQNELKYCIIRPVHTDRTAFPITNASATNAYFIPALALVAANYPSRWIWWGTEALQMVVFGRNLKNIIMEWRWKHGRTRIGGPIVHRLVGCSFRVTPERRYCWKQGTGKKRTPAAVAAAARRANRAAAGQSRGVGSGQLLPGGTTAGVRGGGGNWFGSFFSRSSSPSSTLPYGASSDIPLNQVVTAPRASSEQDTTAIPPQEGRIPDVAAVDDDVDDDEELGCYHCREESPSGITGRIVAVYKPGRPANRARDRPATSRKLEIFTEVGERCETAMMLMCTRLEDLFLSIPDEKKGPFVSSNLRQGGTTDDDAQLDGAVAEGEEGQPEENGETGVLADDSVRSTVSSISLKQRIKGTKASWRARLKWLVAAVLVAVVLVLVLKPKFRH
ncbi:hypothetical protein BGZ83_006491 [Gryganskiella cystojenkinii]|nr:hypothetical protein BGZ83_006491 [Gryganskiella cystojenkinii]